MIIQSTRKEPKLAAYCDHTWGNGMDCYGFPQTSQNI